jgi:two-component system sensor histidine kinase YesM
MDQPIQINISVEFEVHDQERWINILIEDTGAGFPEQILEQLQNELDLTNEEGEHIGIWNVKRRLDLLYPDKASIIFNNSVGRGAAVRIRLPADLNEGG